MKQQERLVRSVQQVSAAYHNVHTSNVTFHLLNYQTHVFHFFWFSPLCLLGSHQPDQGKATYLQCPQGHRCPAGSVNPIICEPGTISDAGADACAPCPAGQHQSSSGQSVCVDCPEGYECPAGSVDPIICVAGAFSEAAAPTCTPCDPGWSTFNAVGATECTICPAGFSTKGGDGSANCINCDPNFYNEDIGSAECTQCAGGITPLLFTS